MTATPEQIQQAYDDPKLANVIYHDWEAGTYDEKWSISYDDRCINYACDRFNHVAGESVYPFGRSLEIGAGTGFFTLNLMLGGLIEQGHITDLSPKMVEVALRTGKDLDLDVKGKPADAESLPYEDNYFDLVCGHAVLHHIPDLDLAMKEVLRVLKPGGTFAFAGEPTERGDVVARKLSQLTWAATTRATSRGPLADRYGRSADEVVEMEAEAALEAVVDIHTFDPGKLQRLCEDAGAADVPLRPRSALVHWVGSGRSSPTAAGSD